MLRKSDCFILGILTGAAACGIFCGGVMYSLGTRLKKESTDTEKDATIEEEIPFNDDILEEDENLEEYERTLQEAGYNTEV